MVHFCLCLHGVMELSIVGMDEETIRNRGHT